MMQQSFLKIGLRARPALAFWVAAYALRFRPDIYPNILTFILSARNLELSSKKYICQQNKILQLPGIFTGGQYSSVSVRSPWHQFKSGCIKNNFQVDITDRLLKKPAIKKLRIMPKDIMLPHGSIIHKITILNFFQMTHHGG